MKYQYFSMSFYRFRIIYYILMTVSSFKFHFTKHFTLQELQKILTFATNIKDFWQHFMMESMENFFEVMILEFWQLHGWIPHRNDTEQLWKTYSRSDLRRDIYWTLCRDRKDIDRYMFLKHTSCFTFFYFCPYKSVNIFNMLSKIVMYHFCVESTDKPVTSPISSAPPIQKHKKKFHSLSL